MPWPLVTTITMPRQKNWVPIVATSEGIPILTTMMPFSKPASTPASRQAAKPSHTLWVATNTTSKAVMPKAMIEGKERSISPVMMTSVSGIAISAKNGVVDMKAT